MNAHPECCGLTSIHVRFAETLLRHLDDPPLPRRPCQRARGGTAIERPGGSGTQTANNSSRRVTDPFLHNSLLDRRRRQGGTRQGQHQTHACCCSRSRPRCPHWRVQGARLPWWNQGVLPGQNRSHRTDDQRTDTELATSRGAEECPQCQRYAFWDWANAG